MTDWYGTVLNTLSSQVYGYMERLKSQFHTGTTSTLPGKRDILPRTLLSNRQTCKIPTMLQAWQGFRLQNQTGNAPVLAISGQIR